jgi:hypothetical protein
MFRIAAIHLSTPIPPESPAVITVDTWSTEDVPGRERMITRMTGSCRERRRNLFSVGHFSEFRICMYVTPMPFGVLMAASVDMCV